MPLFARERELGLHRSIGDGAVKFVSWTWSISSRLGRCHCGNMVSNEDSATTPLFARKREKFFAV